ncbi:hypothetical protein J8J40_30495, partial [Mycobacterium tuberculosis]|nr:hypothetical protein [Mycobacterium tuberculosis]
MDAERRIDYRDTAAQFAELAVAVSRWAGGPDFRFPARSDPSLVALRDAGMLVTRIVIIALVLIGVLKLVGHRFGALLSTIEYLFLL